MTHLEPCPPESARPTTARSASRAALSTLLVGAATLGVVFWMESRWWGDPVYAYSMGLREPESFDMLAMMGAAIVLGVLTAILLAGGVPRRLRKVSASAAVALLLAVWCGVIGATVLLTPTPTFPDGGLCLEGVNDPSAPLPTVTCD